jgi:anti-sigma B factor antagonist
VITLSASTTTTTVTVTGDLDLAEREQFPEVTARVTGLRRQLLVLDLCATEFLDSTGAAFLVSLAESAGRRGGMAVLRGADERNLFVLDICGALGLFRVDRDHRCDPQREPRPFRAGEGARSASSAE